MTDLNPRIFLDTDIGSDCDDTAALAILLQLCREGRARLLGVTHCTGSAYGLAAIDAICRLFGADEYFAYAAFVSCGSVHKANAVRTAQMLIDKLHVFVGKIFIGHSGDNASRQRQQS